MPARSRATRARKLALHPIIAALVCHLPGDGEGWTEDKQARWMAALEANIRLIYTVRPSPLGRRRKHQPFNIEPPY